MNAYNKLFAAIISTLLMRWALKATGFDAVGLGIDMEFRELVALGIDLAVAALNGFFVWLIPNGERLWDWIRGR